MLFVPERIEVVFWSHLPPSRYHHYEGIWHFHAPQASYILRSQLCGRTVSSFLKLKSIKVWPTLPSLLKLVSTAISLRFIILQVLRRQYNYNQRTTLRGKCLWIPTKS